MNLNQKTLLFAFDGGDLAPGDPDFCYLVIDQVVADIIVKARENLTQNKEPTLTLYDFKSPRFVRTSHEDGELIANIFSPSLCNLVIDNERFWLSIKTIAGNTEPLTSERVFFKDIDREPFDHEGEVIPSTFVNVFYDGDTEEKDCLVNRHTGVIQSPVGDDANFNLHGTHGTGIVSKQLIAVNSQNYTVIHDRVNSQYLVSPRDLNRLGQDYDDSQAEDAPHP